MATLPSQYGNFEFPEWQREFEAAVREGDGTRFPERLRAARKAIFSRIRAKSERPPGFLERIALNDAIHLLRVLHSERIPRS